MEMLQNPDEVVFRLTVSKGGKEFYDIGVTVDPLILTMAQLDAVESVFRLMGRRMASDWKDKVF